MLKNNEMKAFLLCLCIAKIIAWPSGVYILGDSGSQFYNPLTYPHSLLDPNINFRNESLQNGSRVCVGKSVHRSLFSTSAMYYARIHIATRASDRLSRLYCNMRVPSPIPRQMEESGRRIYIAPVIESDPSLLLPQPTVQEAHLVTDVSPNVVS